MVDRAKAERIEGRDRSGSHGEHVAQNAANPSRGAMIGFDKRGMVVALDFEHNRQPVSDIDDPRVFSRSLENLRPSRRKLTEEAPRAFVATMLGPHHGENAEFLESRRPVQHVQNTLIFLSGKSVVRGDLRGDGD